jgi:thiamine biosynthesis protein ThiI
MALFMVRYGEIALKSRSVRRRFERALGNNIASRFVESGKECRMELERGRIFLWSDDVDFATRVLSRTFGVVSFSQVMESTSEREDIISMAVEVSKPFFKRGIRFCIRARRSGQHGYTSMELARDAGSAVFLANEDIEPKVDLTRPELEIFIDVRQNRSYIYIGSEPGPGGMPLGTQGRMLGLVKKPGDIAACWLMMKRGCRVIVVTDDVALAQPLMAWDQNLKILTGDYSDIPKLARNRRADGICLGWGIEEFDGRGTEMAEMGMPVFYPLIGMDETEIGELVARILA